jgi:predicted RNase H-like HicB family nuclease
MAQFEIEVHRNEAGEWVASAVEYPVTVTGRTEHEALARIMEALTLHLRTTSRS